MAQIDGAGQQDTDNQNAEALQAALAQRQVTLQGQPQGGSDVPIHQNSDPVSDESEILGSLSLLPENVVYRDGVWRAWRKLLSWLRIWVLKPIGAISARPHPP